MKLISKLAALFGIFTALTSALASAHIRTLKRTNDKPGVQKMKDGDDDGGGEGEGEGGGGDDGGSGGGDDDRV